MRCDYVDKETLQQSGLVPGKNEQKKITGKKNGDAESLRYIEHSRGKDPRKKRQAFAKEWKNK